jgi:spore maturation protein CgeB
LRKTLGALRRKVTKAGKKVDSKLNRVTDRRSSEVLAQEEVLIYNPSGKLKVLYIGLKYDYGRKNVGLDYGHYNFFHVLVNMGLSVSYFELDRIRNRYGDKRMNEVLSQAIFQFQPDILFHSYYLNWVDNDMVKDTCLQTGTKSVIWISDDHWRYEELRPAWTKYDLIVTTDPNGLEKRRNEGFENVLLSQWGCNHYLYKDTGLPRIYDVSFVGRRYGIREDFIAQLRSKGVEVKTYGEGWPGNQRLDQMSMVRLLAQSRIVLNISQSSSGKTDQVKGRDFEVLGCGALLLTKDFPDIKLYYEPGKEIATYSDASDAAEKIKYYLEHEEERAEVAKCGHDSTIREHTMKARMEQIFQAAMDPKNVCKDR